MDEYCDCTGILNLTITIECNSLVKLYCIVCNRDLNPDHIMDMVDTKEPILVSARWEVTRDWETGYDEGVLKLSAGQR